MKNALQLIVLLGLASISTGCASTGAYFIDRGRDAADIVTATIGVGAGATARVGPLHVGLYRGEDLTGLRHGDLWYVPFSRSDTLGHPWDDGMWGGTIDILGYGEDIFSPKTGSGFYRRKCDIDAEGAIPFLFLTDYEHPRTPMYYYTQIEVCMGFGPTVRLGFNPGELLDFILGWITIDIFYDDFDKQKKIEQDVDRTSQ